MLSLAPSGPIESAIEIPRIADARDLRRLVESLITTTLRASAFYIQSPRLQKPGCL